MKVLEVNKTDVKDVPMRRFIIRADKGEDFRPLSLFYHEGKKFKVFDSYQIESPDVIKHYEVIAKYKPQLTKYNYDNIDFLFGGNIERINETQIEIRSYCVTTIITLDSPKECLKEYLMLQNIKKEAVSSDEFAKLRQ